MADKLNKTTSQIKEKSMENILNSGKIRYMYIKKEGKKTFSGRSKRDMDIFDE